MTREITWTDFEDYLMPRAEMARWPWDRLQASGGIHVIVLFGWN
jgi:hypothetical protein